MAYRTMIVVFFDTNVLLQCKELPAIPWGEISEIDEILLLISRPVQEEVDRLKHDGNGRRARNARKANTLFGELIDSKDGYKVVKDRKPKVMLQIAPRVQIEDEQFPKLDFSRPDDRIIAEALEYKCQSANDEVVFLSHDNNPILTAKDNELKYVRVPDSWLLPPENDARDKRIKKLEEEREAFKSNCPAIEVTISSSEGIVRDEVILNRIQFNPLEEACIPEFVSSIIEAFPMATRTQAYKRRELHRKLFRGRSSSMTLLAHLNGGFVPPSSEEIKEYEQKQYPEWTLNVEKFFRELPNALDDESRYFPVRVSIENSGFVAAENVLIRYKLTGGFLFCAPHLQDMCVSEVTVPYPPKAPEDRWIDPMKGLMDRPVLGNLFAANSPPERDRNASYWRPSKPDKNVDCWEFERDVFRHREEPIKDIFVIMIPEDKYIEHGSLEIRVTANNLPEPFQLNVRIHAKYSFGNVFEKAQRILETSLKKIKERVNNDKDSFGAEDIC